MRLLLVAAAIILSTPAIAAPYSSDDRSYRDVADSLPPAEEIDRASDRLHRVLDGLMQVRVGPLVEAVAPDGRADPARRDETLGDMASRDDPYFEQRMHSSIAAIGAGMGDMMARLARLAPALERSLEDMERSVEEATRDLPESYPD